MEFKQHVKGVLIAICTATVLLFVVSFFVGDEVRVTNSYVINKNADSLFQIIKKPENFKKIIDGSEDFDLVSIKNGIGIQYEGFDSKLHTFKYKSFDKLLGLELSYFKEGEEQAVFKYKLIPKESGTVLEYEKIWKLSGNPLSKLLSIGVDEDIDEGMKKDIKKLKKSIQED